MSKQTADEALPLITLQNGKFVLGEQAAHMIESIKGEIGVIGVAGLYRTGKSYVLNRLLGKQDGFAIGPTVNPCTRGIYTWGRPIEVMKNGKKIYYVLIDTEGIGSIQQDQTYDAKIFSLTLLLSSYFIYNSMGMIDEHAIDKLSLVANLTQNIQVKSNSNKTSEKELSDYFPEFLWLLRDFALKLEDESGRPITSTQYLENALQDRPHQKDKNEIRRKLRTMFAARDCVTLVRPVMDESDLQRIDKTPYSKLRNEFRTEMDKLKDKIFEDAPVKRIMGHSIDGKGFVMLITKYLESINSGGVPTIHSAWDSVARLESQSALEDSVNIYKSKLQELEKRIPIDEVELKKLETELRRAAVSHFEDHALGDVKAQFRPKLEHALDDVFKLFTEANDRQSEKFNVDLLQKLYDKHVEAKLKAKQFSTSHDLIASWKAIAAEFKKTSKGANKLIVLTQFQTDYLPQSLTQFVDQLNDINTAKIEHERKKIEEAVKRLEAVQHDVSQAKEKAHRFELEAQREAGEKMREKERSQSLEKEKARLSDELNRIHSQFTEATKQHKATEEELKLQIRKLEEKVRLSEDNARHVQRESTERHGQLQHAQKSNQDLTNENKQLRDQLDKQSKGHEATSSDLQKKVKAVENEKNNLTAELERVRDQVKKLAHEKSTLEKRNEDLTENMKSNSNLSQKERQTHEANLKAEKESNAQLQRQLKELNADLKKKADAIEKERENYEQAKQEVKSMQKEYANKIDSLNNQLDQANREISSADQKRSKAEKESKRLEDEITELRAKLLEAQKNTQRFSFDEPKISGATTAATTSKKRKIANNNMVTEMEIDRPVFAFDEPEEMSQDEVVTVTNNKENKENGSDEAEKPVKAKGRKATVRLIGKGGSFDVVGDTPEKLPAKTAASTSRKRKRGDEEDDEDVPQAKKARVDPEKMTKPQLKQELVKMKVQMPVKDSPKKTYVDLFNKKMNGEI